MIGTSLAFLSLFLGLTVGVHHVELAVDGTPAAVEVTVDGRSCGVRSAPPWRFACDFGDALEPHRLVAVARDAAGGETARASRTVNFEVRQADAGIGLLRDADGAVAEARLVWRQVEGEPPATLEIAFDGEPLPVAAPTGADEVSSDGEPPAAELTFPLPPHDPDSLHFLAAELSFPGGAVARAETAWGGVLGEEVSTRNTAVALELAGGGRPGLAELAAAADLRSAAGEPLQALALDRGVADFVAVSTASATRELALLRRGFERGGLSAGQAGMRRGDRFFLLRPTLERVEAGGDSVDLFRVSPPRAAGDGGLAWQLTHVVFPPGGAEALPDAVAMAGLLASLGGRPRALVLVLGPAAAVADGRFSAAEARRFLARIGVPLSVWYVEADGRTRRRGDPPGLDPAARRARLDALRRTWGEVEEVPSFESLLVASRALRERVDRQRVVWVEGDHLPHEVRLGGARPGLRLLAGAEATESVAGGEAAAAAEAEAGAEAAAPADAASALDPIAAAESEPPAERPAPQPPPEPPPAAVVTEALAVATVEVDVVVTDRQGRPVTDLGREDFTLLDDGRPVEITHFARVAPPPPPGAAEPRARPAEEPPAADPLHLVVYLDGIHLRPEDATRLLDQLGAVLGERLPPGARVAMARREGAGTVLGAFHDDPAALAAEVERLAGATASGGGRDRERRAHLAGTDGSTDLADAMGWARLWSQKEEVETRLALHALGALVDVLAPLPGRKALLHVSSGVPLSPGREAWRAVGRRWEWDEWSLHAARYDLATLFQEVGDRAADARVTLHAVDAAGLRLPTSITPELFAYSAGVGLDDEVARNHLDSVRLLADATGGVALTNRGDVSADLERLAGDLGGHYSLAYTPPEEGRGRRHRLEVRVSRPGLRVRHRQSYRWRSADERMGDAVRAALDVAGTANPLAASLAFGEAERLEGGDLRVPVRVSVPVASLFLLARGEWLEAPLELFVAAGDERGRSSPVESVEVPFRVRSAEAAAARSSTYTVIVPLRMRPGEHRVAVGLRHRATGEESIVVATVLAVAPGAS